MSRTRAIPAQARPAFLVAAFVVVVVFLSAMYFWRSAYREDVWVQHANEVLSANQRLLADVRDVETGQRGYLLTQDPSYLEPYRSGAEAAPGDYEHLRELTASDSEQAQLVAQLHDQIFAKLTYTARTIAVAQSEGFPAAIAIVKTKYGRYRMVMIEHLGAQLSTEVQSDLRRRTEVRSRYFLLAFVSRAIFVVFVLYLLWTLMKAYRQLNTVLECTSDSVITLSPDWTLLYGNSRALESIPDFKVGANYWAMFPDVEGTPQEEHLRRAMSSRRPVRYESFYPPYQRWYAVEVFPSKDGINLFFRDVTEQKTMEVRLAQEQLLREKRVEALSHMAGGLAHEISNPLAIIHGRAADLRSEAAEHQTLPAEEVLRSCDSILRTADRAMKILKGLKGFTREASNDPMAFTVVADIVQECVLLQQSRFRTHGVELRVETEAGLPPVLCRETQIGQILTNLLNNAFDAIVQAECPQRWVELKAYRGQGSILLDVTDSGPGIDEAVKQHVMEPFFTTKAVGGGTGIGLSLSKAIAEDHGGSLTLCTDTPYTRFRLALPVKETKQVSGVEVTQEFAQS